MSHISPKVLKYITSLSFTLNPTSTSTATKSMRLLLSSLPIKPPPGQNAVPQAAISTIAQDTEQRIQVTYSDKKKVDVIPTGLNVRELLRKIEEPARALRAKEEGL